MDDPVPGPQPVGTDLIAGELVTETFDYDGRRRVRVYLPPERPEAVVFAGDGQLISQWGGHLEAADVPPTMIVGAYRTDDKDERVRIQEYSPSSILTGSPNMSVSSSGMSVDGYGRASVWHRPPTALRCAECPPVGSSRSRWDFGIPTSMVRSSPLRPAPVTDHPACCLVRSHVPIWSPARRSPSSWRTRGGGRTRYATPVPTSC
jgi:hypothetical protein